MNISKTLTAAIAATSIVGAVGLAYAQTSTNETPVSPSTEAASAAPRTDVISPADAQRGAAQDPSTQPSTEGTQGTQSGSSPSADTGSTAAPTQSPAMTDSTTSSEPQPKADRN